jgi:hypothetical protein
MDNSESQLALLGRKLNKWRPRESDSLSTTAITSWVWQEVTYQAYGWQKVKDP